MARQRLSSGLAVGLIAVVFKSFVAPSVAQMVNQGEVDSNNYLARQVSQDVPQARATLESIERLTQILTQYEANPHLRHEIVLGMEEPRRSKFMKMLKRIRYPLPGESHEVLWPEVYGPSGDPAGAASPLITIQETENQGQRERERARAERAYNAEAKEDVLRRRILPRQAEPFELSEQEQERERERAAERQRLREMRFRARVGENTRDLTALEQVDVRKTASTAPEHWHANVSQNLRTELLFCLRAPRT